MVYKWTQAVHTLKKWTKGSSCDKRMAEGGVGINWAPFFSFFLIWIHRDNYSIASAGRGAKNHPWVAYPHAFGYSRKRANHSGGKVLPKRLALPFYGLLFAPMEEGLLFFEGGGYPQSIFESTDDWSPDNLSIFFTSRRDLWFFSIDRLDLWLFSQVLLPLIELPDSLYYLFG